MITVLITLTSAGIDLGPFELYSDTDGYAVPFESGITKNQLLAGYSSALVPDATTIIRALSTGVCTNYVDLVIVVPTTTTTTTAAPTTTTTTTALVLPMLDYCYEILYECTDGIHVPPGGDIDIWDASDVMSNVTGICAASLPEIYTVSSSRVPVVNSGLGFVPCTTTTTTTIP